MAAVIPAVIGAASSIGGAVASGGGLAAGIGAGLLASKVMGGGKISTPEPPPLPQPPKPEEAENRAAEIARRKRASMSQSVYTSPLGVSGQATVARKTLLGQ